MSLYFDKYPERKPYETDRDYIYRLCRECEIGVIEAKKIVDKDNLLTDLSRAEDLNDIKKILERMIEEK
jgi:hypothetical protein